MSILLSLILGIGLSTAQESTTSTNDVTPESATNEPVEAVPEAESVPEPAPIRAMDVWNGITKTPALVEYFKDTFDTIGVSIEGTDERFTVEHTGTELKLSEGIAEDVNFRVSISEKQVSNMVKNAEDNQISADESWRIMSVLFTPMTSVTLDNPVFVNNRMRKKLGIEDLTHVYLLNPNGETANSHTLFFVKGQWVVVKGIHGKPRRTYKLTPAQALEYQKKTFSAVRANKAKQWREWAKWYTKWRKGVSVTHK
ncbi:MAG: hypothetical protein VX278_20740 [Myxococcota bacterium]|nr:hypothetical protein [Myxococcota bacterium]